MNPAVRILYHHRTLGDGAEGIHVREMVRALRSLGHEVRVIGPVGERPPASSLTGRRLGALKRAVPGPLFECLEMAYTAHAFRQVSHEVRRFAPDFIYERYITFNAGTTLAARRHRLPICMEVNAPLALERAQQQDERLVFGSVAQHIETWVCANATKTLVVSTPLKRHLESRGVPPEKCIVVPNGVDADRFAPRDPDPLLLQRYGIPADHRVIGFTGVLRAWHGIGLLLEAVAALARRDHRVLLLIVGDGPYRGETERLVAEHGLEQSVRITGRVPHDAVPDLIALFDVAVSPASTFYASPMKVMEYMALAKPVVVPRAPNFLDIVEDSVDGVTFRPGSAADLADALAVLCESPTLRRQIGTRARAKVESSLNWRAIARRVCELFAPEGRS